MWALSEQRPLFQVRPKMHGFEHLCLGTAPYVNPRYVQCLQDEDLMRRVKSIAFALHPKVYSLCALEHYSVALALRWTRGA